MCALACSSRRAQMACAWGASRAVRARVVRCARSGARPRHRAAKSSSLTQATWDAQILPDTWFHLPGSGAKLITHIRGANHYWCLRVLRLGGDLACQPVAPIKAYASQSVRAGGHGHAQGLRRCSWAGVRRAITAKVRSTGCGLTSAWPSAPGKHAPRSLQLPLFSPDKVLFYMVPKRHRQTDGFAVNNRFAEGQ